LRGHQIATLRRRFAGPQTTTVLRLNTGNGIKKTVESKREVDLDGAGQKRRGRKKTNQIWSKTEAEDVKQKTRMPEK